MSKNKKLLGRWGEELASKYLEDQGYEILERNVRTPYGEIDLVACLEQPDSCTIVLVEVKTRRTQAFGPPEEAINARKSAHLLSSAEYYIQQYSDPSVYWRIDVVAIQLGNRHLPPKITHFENVIS